MSDRPEKWFSELLRVIRRVITGTLNDSEEPPKSTSVHPLAQEFVISRLIC